jgi:hypothetical protein
MAGTPARTTLSVLNGVVIVATPGDSSHYAKLLNGDFAGGARSGT